MFSPLVCSHDISIFIGFLDYTVDLMLDVHVDDIQTLVSGYCWMQDLSFLLFWAFLFVLRAATHPYYYYKNNRSRSLLHLFLVFLATDLLLLLLLLLTLTSWLLRSLYGFFLVSEAILPHQLCGLADDQMQWAFFEFGEVGEVLPVSAVELLSIVKVDQWFDQH